MTDPYKQIAGLLEKRMSLHSQKATSWLSAELGTITATGLKLDGFKHEIKDYLMADWLFSLSFPQFSLRGTPIGLTDSQGGSVTGQATFSFQPTEMDGVHGEVQKGLKTGDRVLAIPVNNGQEVVVICKVVS